MLAFVRGLIGALILGILSGHGWAQETAADMPIADLHFHPERDRKPEDFKEVFDRAGVKWFGLGERQGGPPVTRGYKEHFGARMIAFGGQSWMTNYSGGAREAENPNNEQFRQLLEYLEGGLANRTLVGVGELFVNNRSTNPNERLRRKMNIAGPVIAALYELAAKHDGFVAFHMEGDADSVEQLEKLAASNRRGRIILNHCGINLSPQEMDRLFAAHPNLFCELSVRYPPMLPPRTYVKIFDGGGIVSTWKSVIVKHADRFMVGTDVEANESHYVESIKNVRTGLLANLPPEVARKVAFENAVALFGLK